MVVKIKFLYFPMNFYIFFVYIFLCLTSALDETAMHSRMSKFSFAIVILVVFVLFCRSEPFTLFLPSMLTSNQFTEKLSWYGCVRELRSAHIRINFFIISRTRNLIIITRMPIVFGPPEVTAIFKYVVR